MYWKRVHKSEHCVFSPLGCYISVVAYYKINWQIVEVSRLFTRTLRVTRRIIAAINYMKALRTSSSWWISRPEIEIITDRDFFLICCGSLVPIIVNNVHDLNSFCFRQVRLQGIGICTEIHASNKGYN